MISLSVDLLFIRRLIQMFFASFHAITSVVELEPVFFTFFGVMSVLKFWGPLEPEAVGIFFYLIGAEAVLWWL